MEIDPVKVETNIVRFHVRSLPPQALVQRLKARGALVLAVGRDTVRAVTHLMVSAEDVEAALAIIAGVLK